MILIYDERAQFGRDAAVVLAECNRVDEVQGVVDDLGVTVFAAEFVEDDAGIAWVRDLGLYDPRGAR